MRKAAWNSNRRPRFPKANLNIYSNWRASSRLPCCCHIRLKLEQIDWEQQALRVVQGKGRKDRRVYMSPDAVASVQQCLAQHPGACAQGYVFWNRKRPAQPLSVKAIQKKMERYAKAAGITASCHSLRHTFASNLLEHGAEIVAIRDFLGHSQIASSERYAKISSQKIKQEYMRTMQKILKQGQV